MNENNHEGTKAQSFFFFVSSCLSGERFSQEKDYARHICRI